MRFFRPVPSARVLRVAPATVLAALAGAALTSGAASAATHPTTPKVVYVTAGGTATCSTSTASNGLSSLDSALACVTNGATIKIGAGSFGAADAPSARTTITSNITVEGASAAKTTLVNTLQVAAGVTTTVKNLAIDTAHYEVGIVNHGNLTVSHDVITGNQGDNITVDQGGAISNQTSLAGESFSPSLTILDSSITSNGDSSSYPAITLNSVASGSDTATIVNSTISGNDGPGVGVFSGARLTMVNVTDANNFDRPALESDGGIVSVTNTLLAGTTAGAPSYQPVADCLTTDGASISGGHDLVGINECSGIAQGVDGDLAGTMSAPLNPHLGPLAAHGGPTPTQALLAGSPAIRAGDPTACSAAPVSGTDQRGDSRRVGTRGCDIGAYDTGLAPVTLHLSAAKGRDSSCAAGTATRPFATLAFALGCASSGDTLSLAAGSYGTPKQASAVLTLPDENLTLSGTSPASTSVVETLLIPVGSRDTIENLTSDTGLYNTDIVNEGQLTVSQAVVTSGIGDELTTYNAGGISNWVVPGGSPSLEVVDSTLENSQGGGVGPGALYLATPNTGGSDTASVINSTVSGNSNESAALEAASGSALTLRDDTIAANSGIAAGGVLDFGGQISLGDTLLATNTTTSGTPADCYAGGSQSFVDNGHNLIGDADSCPGLGTASGDLAGTTAAPLDPHLGALTANGGPTPTQALLPASPAIGAGDPADCQAAPVDGLDQRGSSRNVASRGACDIGAYDTGS